ncbi:MAG TPA: DNA repair protein RecN [Candidatus Alectryocaccobium stercorigallinarum]|nr:DNA repair protein RecN [Candidatus Alectryocaccobium stercorigallinarum]
MLLNLHVKNMALIKEIDIDFKNGLNVITGETGAGKSLLLGSVNLALGGKFSKDMLREGEDSALVELVFSVDDGNTLNGLKELGYPAEDGELIITRKISDGRASAKINGEACPLSVLRSIAEILINVHGQRENQTLLKAENQLKLIDSYGKKELGAYLEEVSGAYEEYKRAEGELEKYSLDEEKRLRELSMLEYEINEIETAAISDGEEDELEKKYRLMMNSRKIIDTLKDVYSRTGYDGGAGEFIGQAVREIEAVSDLDEELKSIADALSDVEAILSDVNRQTASYLDEFTFSEQEFNDIQTRLDTIRNIESKYGSTVEKINGYLENARERMEFLQNYEADRKNAEAAYGKAKEELNKKCEELSDKRKECAKSLAKELSKQLEELNFQQAVIDSEFTRAQSYRRNGFDDVEILISTNPGEPVKPLARIASGGELSRIMLAVKNIIADEENTGTLIFDEIDSGISGRTAQKVSEKMASIARGHQILCVTHLAQIAAMADEHFVIEKNSDGGGTVTAVSKLDEEEKTDELARILGGAKITGAARANAKEMKEMAQEYKARL